MHKFVVITSRGIFDHSGVPHLDLNTFDSRSLRKEGP